MFSCTIAKIEEVDASDAMLVSNLALDTSAIHCTYFLFVVDDSEV